MITKISIGNIGYLPSLEIGKNVVPISDGGMELLYYTYTLYNDIYIYYISIYDMNIDNTAGFF